MKTYWSSSVAVNGQVKCPTRDVDLPRALGKSIKSAIYYLAIYPNASITIEETREQCSLCWNAGTVKAGKNGLRGGRCPECKGKGATGRVGSIPVCLSDDSKLQIIQTA